MKNFLPSRSLPNTKVLGGISVALCAAAGIYMYSRSRAYTYVQEESNNQQPIAADPFTSFYVDKKTALDFSTHHSLSPKDLIELRDYIASKPTAVGHITWHSEQVRNQAVNEIEQAITKNNKQYQQHPSDLVHALLSSGAYPKESHKQEAKVEVILNKNVCPSSGNWVSAEAGADYKLSSPDWQIHKVIDNTNITGSGHYAVIYVNHQKKQVVLAHKGSIKSIKDWVMTNFWGVFLNRETYQEADAFKAADEAARYSTDNGYNLSITGHSLGGWLAILSLQHIVQQQSMGSIWPDLDVRAITFDNPGAYPALKRNTGKLSREEIYLNYLNVTTYTSNPNFVNTTKTHIGRVYGISDDNHYKRFGAGHSIDKYFISLFFNPSTGKPYQMREVYQWGSSIIELGYVDEKKDTILPCRADFYLTKLNKINNLEEYIKYIDTLSYLQLEEIQKAYFISGHKIICRENKDIGIDQLRDWVTRVISCNPKIINSLDFAGFDPSSALLNIRLRKNQKLLEILDKIKSVKHQKSEYIAGLYAELGKIELDSNHYSEAWKWYKKRAEILLDLWGVPYDSKQFPPKINFLLDGLQLGKASKSIKELDLPKQEKLAQAFYDFGHIKYKEGITEDALEYLKSAMIIRMDLPNSKTFKLVQTMNAYYSIKVYNKPDFDNDFSHLEHAYEIINALHEENPNDDDIATELALSFNNLGVCYYQLYEHKKGDDLHKAQQEIMPLAIGNFNRCKNLLVELYPNKDHPFLANIYQQLAGAYIRLGNKKEVVECYKNLYEHYGNISDTPSPYFKHDFAKILINYANFITHQYNNQQRGIELKKYAYVIYCYTVGDNHQDTVDLLQELAEESKQGTESLISELQAIDQQQIRIELQNEFAKEFVVAGNGSEIHETNSWWYEYTNKAMEQILELRLKSEQLEGFTVLSPNYVWNNHENVVAKLADEIASKIHSGAEKILVPLNLYGKHWIGIILELSKTSQISISYIDSEQNNSPEFLSNKLLKGLSSLSPEVSFTFEQINVEKQEYNNCGLEVIENMILHFTGTRESQEEALELHSKLFEEMLLSGVTEGQESWLD